MDCERAKQLIDLKVDAMVSPPAGAPGGTANPGAAPGGMAKLAAGERRHVPPEPSPKTFAELDAHLATCPTCAADYRELLRTRELLADLAAETPTEQEMDKILTTLQSTGHPTASREGEAGWPTSSEVGDTKIAAAGWHGSESPRDEASQTRARREDRTDRSSTPSHAAVRSANTGPSRAEPLMAPMPPTRRAFIGPLVAAGLAIAACLGIAYTIGQQHYSAPARCLTAASPSRLEALRAPVKDVDEAQRDRADQPAAGGKIVLGTELRRLQALGYDGATATDAKSADHDNYRLSRIGDGYQPQFGAMQLQSSENVDSKTGLLPEAERYGRVAAGAYEFKSPPDLGKVGETLRGAAHLGFEPGGRSSDDPGKGGGAGGGSASQNPFDGDYIVEAGVERTPPPTPALPEVAGSTGRGDFVVAAKYAQPQPVTPSGTGDGEAYLIRGRGANVIAPGVTVSRLDNSVLRPDRNSDGVADEGVLVGDGVVSFTGSGGNDAVDYAYVATAAKPSDNYYLPAHEVPGSGAQANTLQDPDTGAAALLGDDTLATYFAGVSPTRYGGVTVVSSRNPEPGTAQHAQAADKTPQSGKFYAEARQPEALPAPAAASAPTSQLVAQPRPKIIKTGELGVEVPEYAPAYAQVQAIVARFRAFVADVNSQEGPGGAVTSKVTIRVVPEEFEALFGALKAVGRVESENVKAADVTAQYVDLEARIKASQINEERLQELVKSKSIIDKMASLLEVERELARVRTEIEQMQGQLRVMADHISLSTLAVTLREPARVVPSAALSVEVPVLADAADALGKALEERGGRLTSGKISRRKDGTFQGDYQLEVTLDHFDDVLHAIEGLGRVEDRQVKDRRYSDATAVWAAKVKCPLALVLYESARDLPKGEAAVEVDALAPALARLSDLLKAHSGTIAANRTSQRDDGSSLADLKLAVPAGNFAAFAATLDTLGRVTARQLSGEAGRVVGGAADVMCDVALRLAERPRQIPSGNMTIEVEKFETARQQISALVAQKGVQVIASGSAKRSDGTTTGQFRLGIKAADMETVVGRLESLGRVDARAIAGLGLGDLSTIDPSTVGVIDLSLHEKAAISPDPSRAGDSIRAHFTDGLAGLYRSAGLIVYGLMTMVPWVLVTGAALWIIARVFRKRPTTAAPVKP